MVEKRDGNDFTGDSASVGAPEVTSKRPRVKRIPARLVGAAGTTYLVEWAVKDDLKRAYIPGETWSVDGVDEDVLAAGVPYGANWEAIIKLHLSSADVARTLRASGIWTVEDYRARIEEVEGLFKRAMQFDVFTVLSKMEG
jgi:hypothetical protein